MSSSLLRDIEPNFPPNIDEKHHYKEALRHLRSMNYGEFMTIVEAATTSSNHNSGKAVRDLVAKRLWKWLMKNP